MTIRVEHDGAGLTIRLGREGKVLRMPTATGPPVVERLKGEAGPVNADHDKGLGIDRHAIADTETEILSSRHPRAAALIGDARDSVGQLLLTERATEREPSDPRPEQEAERSSTEPALRPLTEIARAVPIAAPGTSGHD